MSKDSTTKVFLTGATGYIGGEVLYQLLSNGQFDVTALVRSEKKADILRRKTNDKVKTVLGSLDDSVIISAEVDRADVVINTANVDHVPSAQVMAETLKKKTKKTVFIHTSGTSVIGDDLDSEKGRLAKVYSDIGSIKEINLLDESQPHRPVDKIVLSIEEENPLVKTVVVSPSTIFGKSNGYDNVYSVQIPYLAQLSKDHGKAFTVYLGDYIWSHIHISDLGDLYFLLLSNLLADHPIPTGKEGYYFGAYTDNSGSADLSPIEHTWRDVSAKIGELLHEKGLVSSPEPEPLSPDTIVSFSGNEFAPFYWGTNSRSRGDNGIRIGWKPKYAEAKVFWDSISDDVEYAIGK